MLSALKNTLLTGRVIPSYILLALSYFTLCLLLPANQATLEKYNLTSSEYHLLIVTVVLPRIAIWGLAFLGYARLSQYARSIGKTPEGGNFRQLAAGFGWLAWSLPVTAITTTVFNSLGNQSGPNHAGVIIVNYVNLILPLIAFTLIGGATRGLINRAKFKFSANNIRGILICFLLTGVTYCFIIFRHFDHTTITSSSNSFFMPAWLVLLTVTIPFIYTWFIGILAAFEITLFSRKVGGVLYRQALGNISLGLTAVIISLIGYQYVAAIQTPDPYANINFASAVLVFFRLMAGLGFLAVTAGAMKLKKIEEV